MPEAAAAAAGSVKAQTLTGRANKPRPRTADSQAAE